MQANSDNVLLKLVQNGKQGGRKFASLVHVHGLWGAFRMIWKNVLLIEMVCRLEKDLIQPDVIVDPRIPIEIKVLGDGFDLKDWPGAREIRTIRGDYGLQQFYARLHRGDLCFTAYSRGNFVGFVWLEFPPGDEAGYPLQPEEAYTYDGWTFDKFRGKRVLPVIQQAIMIHVREHNKEIRRLVTHVAAWNKASLSGDQRAGYIIQRLERTIMILGLHTKRILNRDIPVDLVMQQR